MTIQAVTFDFWDTIAIDDSDEAKRAAKGLPSKPQARANLLASELSIPLADAEKAVSHAYSWFEKKWKNESKTPATTKQLEEAYLFLGRKKTKGFADLAHHFETMEVEISPDPAHGVIDCLKELKGKYKLCIISDTIYTYGKGLREILEQFGVLDCFSGFIFSDEVGASKPSPKVFEAASKALKIDLRDMIHIGDRESNDVLGPLSVGMKAALYTGIKDRGGSESKANLVYRDHSQLPGLLEKL